MVLVVQVDLKDLEAPEIHVMTFILVCALNYPLLFLLEALVFLIILVLL